MFSSSVSSPRRQPRQPPRMYGRRPWRSVSARSGQALASATASARRWRRSVATPRSSGPILVPMLIGLGFAEAIAIYALVIAFILVGKV